jgi:thioredoxin reductase
MNVLAAVEWNLSFLKESILAKRVAIIGAGPIGLEAAVLGVQKGFDVTVLEANSVAQNVRSWGHVRLFSPFALNSSSWGKAAVDDVPGDSELLSGREYFDRYLSKLHRLSAVSEVIREGQSVLSVGRKTLLKNEAIGQTTRLESPFQLLVRNRLESKKSNSEWVLESDFVLDCSGTYPNHGWIGSGGIPAIGERSLGDRIEYGLPDVLQRDRAEYENKRVLVVGSGYSAATSIVALAKLKEAAAETSITWVTRRLREQPISLIENDSLHERSSLTLAANRTVSDEVDWKPGCLIESLSMSEDHVEVLLTNQAGEHERLQVDRIIGNVGYRPDSSLHQELQIHQCYATEGPIKLAASLMGQSSADCMTQESPGLKTLMNPEPGYLILGSKSYGRDSRFLLRIGIEQVEVAYSLIETEWS